MSAAPSVAGAQGRTSNGVARESHVPEPRRVSYDWSTLPLHWIPDDPHTTHVLNSIHLFLPAGERWFVKVFKQALPLIEDDLLREQVRAFMGQEGMHATAHDVARKHLDASGLDAGRYLRRLDTLFEDILGERDLPPRLNRQWLNGRLAAIAAIEHYTAVLGEWVLEADGLDVAGADPTMMDLLRWHGAEEVEHRSVAFDLYQHLCGSWPLRAAVAQVVFPALTGLVWSGARTLLEEDPGASDRRFWRPYVTAARKGRLPSIVNLFVQGPLYLSPRYHPSRYGDLQVALDYIARSPSHQAAASVGSSRSR